jgi:hypothetical protein
MHPKVLGSALAGAIVTVLLFIFQAIWPTLNFPDGVEAALIVIVMAVIGWLVPGTWQIPVESTGPPK